MSWLRIDDRFTSHPKLAGWTPAKRWAWLEVMAYCSRYQTDGVIPNDLSLMPRTTSEKLLADAQKAGLIDVDEAGRRVIHDWAAYNPKDPTKAERQARWRRRNDDRVDTNVDADVDGRVDETIVYGDGPSRAGARARPRPVPKNNPSFLPSELQDEDGRTETEIDWNPLKTMPAA